MRWITPEEEDAELDAKIAAFEQMETEREDEWINSHADPEAFRADLKAHGFWE